MDDREFNLAVVYKTPIADEWEFGRAFSRGNERLRIWRLSLDRFGLAYRFSSSGDFRGFNFVFASVFDR